MDSIISSECFCPLSTYFPREKKNREIDYLKLNMLFTDATTLFVWTSALE